MALNKEIKPLQTRQCGVPNAVDFWILVTVYFAESLYGDHMSNQIGCKWLLCLTVVRSHIRSSFLKYQWSVFIGSFNVKYIILLLSFDSSFIRCLSLLSTRFYRSFISHSSNRVRPFLFAYSQLFLSFIFMRTMVSFSETFVISTDFFIMLQDIFQMLFILHRQFQSLTAIIINTTSENLFRFLPYSDYCLV